jgi:hypothetical protein
MGRNARYFFGGVSGFRPPGQLSSRAATRPRGDGADPELSILLLLEGTLMIVVAIPRRSQVHPRPTVKLLDPSSHAGVHPGYRRLLRRIALRRELLLTVVAATQCRSSPVLLELSAGPTSGFNPRLTPGLGKL